MYKNIARNLCSMLVDEYNHLVVNAVVVAAVAGYGVPFSSCFYGDVVVDVLFLFEIDPKKIKKDYFLFFCRLFVESL